MGVVYPWIRIGYWIGSYLTVHRIIVHRGGVLMYWNWGLDWVILDLTIIWVVYLCIGIGSYLTVNQQNEQQQWYTQVPFIEIYYIGFVKLFPIPIPNLLTQCWRLLFTIPRGNFVYKLGTILSSNARTLATSVLDCVFISLTFPFEGWEPAQPTLCHVHSNNRWSGHHGAGTYCICVCF